MQQKINFFGILAHDLKKPFNNIIGFSEILQAHLQKGNIEKSMNQEVVEQIFRLDGNIKSHGTANEPGTGLGLILCREFVEKHGGSIWVKSKPGEGSSFFFSLPGR